MPIIEHASCQSRACVEIMLTDEFEEFLAGHRVFDKRKLHHIHITEVIKRMVRVIDVCHTATHAGSKVTSCFAKHHNTSACHIFAAVVAGTLNDSNGTGVTHAEALTHLTIYIQFATGGTIETRITGNDILLGLEVVTTTGWRQNSDASARETFSEIVITFARTAKAPND